MSFRPAIVNDCFADIDGIISINYNIGTKGNDCLLIQNLALGFGQSDKSPRSQENCENKEQDFLHESLELNCHGLLGSLIFQLEKFLDHEMEHVGDNVSGKSLNASIQITNIAVIEPP